MYMTDAGKRISMIYKTTLHREYCEAVIADDVELEIQYFFGDARKRDIDNYKKILLDSMSGIVYADDSLIQADHTYKDIDRDDPRVVVKIRKWQPSKKKLW